MIRAVTVTGNSPSATFDFSPFVFDNVSLRLPCLTRCHSTATCYISYLSVMHLPLSLSESAEKASLAFSTSQPEL